jgi:hypothetical protein
MCTTMVTSRMVPVTHKTLGHPADMPTAIVGRIFLSAIAMTASGHEDHRARRPARRWTMRFKVGIK